MVDGKRNSRSYKCSDKFYNKARRRAKKEGTTVAAIVESSVISYAMEFDKSEKPINPKDN